LHPGTTSLFPEVAEKGLTQFSHKAVGSMHFVDTTTIGDSRGLGQQPMVPGLDRQVELVGE
jgi:hypothetical protein